MKNVEDLLIFAKVVELHSFTAAADSLRTSRSLISKKITNLENRLGVQLLHRTTRQLNVTEAGRTLYGYCQQLNKTLFEAETALGDIRHKPGGSLNITASITFGQNQLTKIIHEFLNHYPDIEVKLSLSDEKVDLIAGGFDVAVRIGRKLHDSSLRARKVGSTKMELLANKRYLSDHSTPTHPDDLRQHNCLIYKHMGDKENHWKFRDKGHELTVHVDGNFSADNGVPLLQSAIDGLGIAYVPDFMLNKTTNDQVVKILCDYTEIDIGIYAVYPDNKQKSINTRVFIDLLTSQLTK